MDLWPKITLILVCVIVLMSGAWYVRELYQDNIQLKKENKEYSDALAVEKASVSRLSNALKKQNAAISALRAESEKRIADGKRRLEQAKAESKKYEDAAQEILNGKSANDDQCQAANEIINKEILRGK